MHPDSERITHFHLPLYARRTISSKALRKAWKLHLLNMDTNRLQVAEDFSAIASVYASEFLDLQDSVRTLTAEKAKLISEFKEAKEAASTELVKVQQQCKKTEAENTYFRENARIELAVTLSGSRVTIYPRVIDTVKEVKATLNALVEIPVIKQALFMNLQELSDDKTIESYKIPNKTMLFVKRTFQVFVKRSNTITVTVCEDSSIGDLKQRIQDKEAIPAEWQSLSYRGKLLHNMQSLRSCRITEKTTVNLVIRMPAKTVDQLLFIRSEVWDLFTVDYNGEEAVNALKKKIGKKIKVDPKTLVLEAGDTVLEDSLSLTACHVGGGSELTLKVSLPQKQETDEAQKTDKAQKVEHTEDDEL